MSRFDQTIALVEVDDEGKARHRPKCNRSSGCNTVSLVEYSEEDWLVQAEFDLITEANSKYDRFRSLSSKR